MIKFDIIESGFSDPTSPYAAIALKKSMMGGVDHAHLAFGWHTFREGKTIDDLYNTMPPWLRLVRTTIKTKKFEKLFGNPNGEYISVNIDCNQAVAVDGVLNSVEEASKLRDLWLSEYLEQSGTAKGRIHIIGKTSNGLGLFELGTPITRFEPLNYPAIQGDYNHIKDCLNSSDPCGRLILIEGSPGTGKSYLIRSLVASLNCVAIFVPSGLVGALSGPDLAPILLSQREEVNRPIVLILEDADSALIDRKAGNLDSLSSMLNLGDGLFGQLADVRIIATTNAEKTQFDPAILRPGRLCRHLITKTLSRAEATTVYRRLVPESDYTFYQVASLAEIYRKARLDGWEPEVRHESDSNGQYL